MRWKWNLNCSGLSLMEMVGASARAWRLHGLHSMTREGADGLKPIKMTKSWWLYQIKDHASTKNGSFRVSIKMIGLYLPSKLTTIRSSAATQMDQPRLIPHGPISTKSLSSIKRRLVKSCFTTSTSRDTSELKQEVSSNVTPSSLLMQQFGILVLPDHLISLKLSDLMWKLKFKYLRHI